MRKTTLFIAMSLDGYIANQNGGVEWLSGSGSNEENMKTYNEFIKKIDTVIMGHTTYHQLVTELSPDSWVYKDKKTFVITHRDYETKDTICFTSEDPCDLVKRIQEKEGSGIWICGGASIIQQLMQENLIDIYHITLIPIILGNGIPLFHAMDKSIMLSLKDTISYHGITDVIYERKL